MNLQRIADLAKAEQTDQVKKELFQLTKQFVLKLWRHYFPHCSGSKDDLDDLIYDFYLEFLTPKSRVKGNEQSLLDKWDPEKLNLPSLVKVSVIRKLIDKERTFKHEKHYSETYDENTGDLSLDFLAKQVSEEDVQLEDIEFTEDEIFEMRDKYDEMDPEAKEAFLTYYNRVKNKLPQNFKDLFADLVGTDAPKAKTKAVKETAKSEDPEVVNLLKEAIKSDNVDAEVSMKTSSAGPVARISFNEATDETKVGSDLWNKVQEIIKTNGYKVYMSRGKNWYFIKES